MDYNTIHVSKQGVPATHSISKCRWVAVTGGNPSRVTADITPEQQGFCEAQAAISSTASLASFFWTSCIALNIYLTVVKQDNRLITKYRLLPHIICWGVPAVVLIVTESERRYGLNECTGMLWWCWIKFSSNDRTLSTLITWQLVTGKVWEITSYVFVAVMYTLVVLDISSYVGLWFEVFSSAYNNGDCARMSLF